MVDVTSIMKRTLSTGVKNGREEVTSVIINPIRFHLILSLILKIKLKVHSIRPPGITLFYEGNNIFTPPPKKKTNSREFEANVEIQRYHIHNQ